MKKILTMTILVLTGALIGRQAATWNPSHASAQNSGAPKTPATEGYVLERDAEVAKPGPAPHSGPGRSTGYSFFEKAANFKQVSANACCTPARQSAITCRKRTRS